VSTIQRLLNRLRGSRPSTVTPAEADQRTRAGAVLVDVREPSEWAAGHAPAAKHIPLGDLTRRLGELPADKPLLTVCRSGRRSAQAAALLAGSGREVHNVRGGMTAWAGAGLPVVGKGGRPGRVS
jgi:rhodanese-related sulfurtransferase